MITDSLQKQKSLDLYLYINKIVLIYQQTEKRHDYICPKLLNYASGLLDGYWAQLGFSFLQLTDLERRFMCPRNHFMGGDIGALSGSLTLIFTFSFLRS